MRRFLWTILLSFLIVAPAVSGIVKLESSPSVAELRGACGAAGGSFSVHPDGGGYACTKENCDGEGGDCIVSCDNNNTCHGDTPMILVNAMTLLGILQNGNMVFHDKTGSFGGGGLSSSSDDSEPILLD